MAEDGSGDAEERHKHHHDPDPSGRGAHWVYSVFFSLLFTVLDFAFLFPENHLLALLSLAAALSVVVLYETWKMDRRPVGEGAAIAIFAACLIVYRVVGPNEEPGVSFTLRAADEPMPQTGCDPNSSGTVFGFFGGLLSMHGPPPKNPVPKDATVIAVGTNGVILTASQSVPVIQLGKCALVSMQKGTDRLLINASIYDTSGNLVGGIKNNVFTSVENSGLQVSQEKSLNALSVHDAYGERLWIRFLNPHAVRIRGDFICPGSQWTHVLVTDQDVEAFPNQDPTLPLIWAGQCITDLPFGVGPPAAKEHE